MKRTLFISFFLLLIHHGNSQTQQVVGSAGNSVDTGAYQVSWTIGEAVTSTGTSTSNIVTQGFHQSRLTVVSVQENLPGSLSISVFPNPTNDILNLNIIGDNANEKISYELYNAVGKLVSSKVFTGKSDIIDTEVLSAGTYILKIINSDRVVKTLNIIKTK